MLCGGRFTRNSESLPVVERRRVVFSLCLFECINRSDDMFDTQPETNLPLRLGFLIIAHTTLADLQCQHQLRCLHLNCTIKRLQTHKPTLSNSAISLLDNHRRRQEIQLSPLILSIIDILFLHKTEVALTVMLNL
mmetsp:Transcript_1671/g.5845  ORF Transcript_1671/g.5845 Transcript_1671/m.5845 type:complete len:135 (+) Transcript_1671:1077-1481(+)